MPRCSICKRATGLTDGIVLMNEEHKVKAKGDFVCWECWYSNFVDQPIVEDDTTKTIETPHLRAMRRAIERRRSR